MNTGPTLNLLVIILLLLLLLLLFHLLLLLRTSVGAFTLKVSLAPISVRVLVLNDPPTRFSPNSKFLLMGTLDSNLRLWDIQR